MSKLTQLRTQRDELHKKIRENPNDLELKKQFKALKEEIRAEEDRQVFKDRV